MKHLARLSLVLLCTLIFVTSCEKDDPQPNNYLTSFKYSPDTKTVAEKTAWTGPAATKTPTKAKVKFAIKSLKKGTEAFTNPTKGIKIDPDTGKLSLAADNTLEKAVYEVSIEGTDQNKTSIKKTATFKITIN